MKTHLIVNKRINCPCTCIIVSFIHCLPELGPPLQKAPKNNIEYQEIVPEHGVKTQRCLCKSNTHYLTDFELANLQSADTSRHNKKSRPSRRDVHYVTLSRVRTFFPVTSITCQNWPKARKGKHSLQLEKTMCTHQSAKTFSSPPILYTYVRRKKKHQASRRGLAAIVNSSTELPGNGTGTGV